MTLSSQHERRQETVLKIFLCQKPGTRSRDSSEGFGNMVKVREKYVHSAFIKHVETYSNSHLSS